jgi:lipopolysaccharide transport system permease protein
MEATTTTSTEPVPVTIVEPARGWPHPNLRELWAARDLMYFLARRDVVVQYKQAVVGIFWVVLQPVILTVVFAVFFGLLQKVESIPGVPYPLLVISGFTVWIAFSKGATMASVSTISAESLISKVYFPRMAIPIAAVVPATVDFMIGLLVFIGAALIYGFVPGPAIILAPLAWVLALSTALGVGFWLSALNVAYRDVGVAVPFMFLAGMFISPIAYPFQQVPDNLQPFYALNPMVGVLEFFRWSVLGTDWPGLTLLMIPVISGIVLMVSGAYYYRRAESGFADII